MSDSARTEKPTPRRLQKAREEGRFPSSREFIAGVQFCVFVTLLAAFGAEAWHGLGRIMRGTFAAAFRTEVTPAVITTHLTGVILPNLSSLAFLSGGLLAATIATQLLVTQGGVAIGQLAPNLSRLSPLAKLTSLPKQNLPALAQALLLLPVFAFAIWGIIRPRLEEFLALPLAPVSAGAGKVVAVLNALLWQAALVFGLFGVVDLLRQRRRYMNELKMSTQEIRDEHKELEGNPQIKMRIRRIQRDLMRRNMMKAIPTATAVITNPTHFAVAIQYSLESPGAPTVVAKGKNYLALRIKQRAIDHDVPIVENPPLAQALYKSVDIGQEIPPNLYRAVAEVLAYIFRLTQGVR